MENSQNEKALTVRGENTGLRNKTLNVTAIRRANAGSSAYVPHVNVDEVRIISETAKRSGRFGNRNALLIKFIFDSCLRVSEALSVRPCDIQDNPDGWTVRILGKGRKAREVAISSSIAAELQSFCYRESIGNNDRIFPITRSQVFRIVSDAFDKSAIIKPTKERDRVGAVHILRHSGAIERLRVTGNPKAVQDHLGHVSAEMTMRYMKTISAEESLRIQQGVELW